MDEIDAAIIDQWENGASLASVAYTATAGQLLLAVRDATGVELSFRELWLRLISLRDRCEILCSE